MSEETGEAVPEVAEATPEAPAEGAPEAEKPPPDRPAEQLSGISGKMALLLRKEQATQAKIHREKESIRADREAIQRERAEIEAYKAHYAKVKSDPLEGLRETGLSYEELTKRILSDGKPSPEHELSEVKREIAEWKAEKQREKEEAQSKTMAQQIEAGKQHFEDFVFNSEDDYPFLTLYDKGEVRESAWKVATEYYQKTGEPPDPKELAEFLEQQASSRYTLISERRSQRLAAKESQGKPEERAVNGKGAAAKATPGTRTLTHGLAAERAAPEIPADVSKLSPAEQDAFRAEFLKKHLYG